MFSFKSETSASKKQCIKIRSRIAEGGEGKINNVLLIGFSGVEEVVVKRPITKRGNSLDKELETLRTITPFPGIVNLVGIIEEFSDLKGLVLEKLL